MRAFKWQVGLVSVLAVGGVIVPGNFISAQITPDDTLGSERSMVTPLDNSGIPVDRIDGGAIRGSNLFHSFLEFNVKEDRGAYFFSPNADIQNILARVTGSNRSEILGTIGTFGNSNPNLFLINPNGIFFGPKASLDMGNAGLDIGGSGGSFVATTADAILLGNTGIFNASEPVASNLITVSPSALFFNAVAAQPIINQSTANNSVLGFSSIGLQVPNSRSLLLVGGDVSLEGGILQALGGRVELGGVAASGTVGLNIDGNDLHLSFPTGVTRADVSLVNLSENVALVDVSAGGGGSTAVNAHNLDILGGILLAGISRDFGSVVGSQAGNIEINATDKVRIESSISAPSRIGNVVDEKALGSAGNIIIDTGSLNISDSTGSGDATIVSITRGQGNAGDIVIRARDGVSFSGGGVSNTADSSAIGDGSDINIWTPTLFLSNYSQLSASTFGQGNSGNIQINATDSVSISSGSRLGAISLGQGNAGNIVINAPDAVVAFDGFKVLDDGSFQYTAASTSVASALSFVGTGQGGDIRIAAKSLFITNGARVFTDTSGQIGPEGRLANAGNIIVSAADSVVVSGGSQLETKAIGQGNAGNVTIDAPDATVSFDGVNIINSTSLSSGIISTVEIITGFVGDRQGGNITVKARSLSLTDGARLLASTYGRGNAGNISIDVGDGDVTFAGGDFSSGYNSGIGSNVESGAVGNAGTIDLKAGSLSLLEGAQVSTLVRQALQLPDGTILPPGQGNGGVVNINVSDITLDGSTFDQVGAEVPSAIASYIDEGATGNGGNINIQANSLSLSNYALIDSTLRLGAVGKGGDIDITKLQSFSITNGAQLRTDTSGQGNAGNVTIDAPEATISFDGIGMVNRSLASGEIALSPSPSGIYSFLQALPGFVGDRQGGNITVKARSLSLTDGARLLASTLGRGNAGNISIDVGDGDVTFAGGNFSSEFSTGIGSNVESGALGNAGTIDLKAGSLSLTKGAEVATLVRQALQLPDGTILPPGQGNGGVVNINAGDITLDGSSFNQAGEEFASGIASFIDEGARGNGGNINILTNSLSLSNTALIDSTLRLGAVGKGGDINVTARSLSLSGGAQLITSTLGQGNAGDLQVSVADSTQLIGSSAYATGLFAQVEQGAMGRGGDLTVKTGRLIVQDGAEVSASTASGGQGGTLTVTAPESVTLSGGGQLSTQATANGNAGGLTINTLALTVQDGAEVSSSTKSGIGGDITLTGLSSLQLSNDGQISAATETGRAGSLSLSAAESVQLSGQGSGLITQATADRGNAGNLTINTLALTVQDGAQISASTTSGAGGDILLEGLNSLQVNNGGISASTDDGQAGNLSVNAAESIQLSGEGGLSARANGNGSAGSLTISTRQLTVRDGAEISALTAGSGKAGTLTVTAPESVALSGGRLSTQATGDGNAGDLTINTGQLIVQDGAEVSSSTRSGVGGDITVAGLNSLHVSSGGQVSTSTESGRAGNLSVNASGNAAEVVQLSGQGSELSARGNDGDAGSLTINTRQLTVQDGAQVSASTTSGQGGDVKLEGLNSLQVSNRSQISASTETGTAGSLNVSAVNSVHLSGQGSGLSVRANKDGGNAGSLTIDTLALSVQDEAEVNASTTSGQQGGNITLQGLNSLQVSSGGQISASTQTGRAGSLSVNAVDSVQLSGQGGELSVRATDDRGDAGSLTINTLALSVQDGAQVSASTTSGVGGDITLDGLNSLQVSNGGQISTSTLNGQAGSLSVNAADSVQLNGNGSALSARATAGGSAGNLTINTRQLTVEDGAEATVSSPQGQAGSLTVTTNSLRLDQANLTAVTGRGQGEGGANINLQVQDLLLMGNESQISADALGTANGGNINIDTDFLIALPPQGANGSDIAANAFQGNGGRLNITAQGILGIEFRPSETVLNDITASSEFGSAGVVTLTTPDVDLQNSLTELAANFVSPDYVVAGSCLARRNVERGSFTVTGTGGLPSSPYEAMSGRYVVTGVQPIQGIADAASAANVVKTAPWRLGNPVQEAQGMTVTAEGRIILGTAPQLVAVDRAKDLICQPN